MYRDNVGRTIYRPWSRRLKAIVNQDRRHCQKMATLLADAFVALNGQVPWAQEAEQWAAISRSFLTSLCAYSSEAHRAHHSLSISVKGAPIPGGVTNRAPNKAFPLMN